MRPELESRRAALAERLDVTMDVHAHVDIAGIEALIADHPGVSEQRALEARRIGSESMPVTLAMLRDIMPRMTRTDLRLAEMERSGVDMHLLSPSPGQYHYWAEASLAREICEAANEEVAGLIDSRPDRFGGVGMVPLQHPDLMPDLLEHAILGHGLSGVEISSFAPDPGGGTIELSDLRLDPLWERAAELGAMIFLHPLGCTLDDRLDRFYLSNVVGQPVESAIALSHLIVSGVLDRHPDLCLLASHGGGYLPTYIGRFDHGWEARQDVRVCDDRPSSYLRKLYYDSLVYQPAALRMLVDVVGADRIMLGTDYPFDMGIDDPLDRLLEAGLSDEQTDAIAGQNARALGLIPERISATHERNPT